MTEFHPCGENGRSARELFAGASFANIVANGETIEHVVAGDFRRVLVAVDASGPSREALAIALGIAKKFGATLVLCHVVSSVRAYTKDEGSDFDESGSSLLSRASQTASENEVAFEVRLLHGEPLEQLLKMTVEAQIDLVVMGTHARRGLNRFYIGSVAEGVLKACLVPVLVVREPPSADRAGS